MLSKEYQKSLLMQAFWPGRLKDLRFPFDVKSALALAVQQSDDKQEAPIDRPPQ